MPANRPEISGLTRLGSSPIRLSQLPKLASDAARLYEQALKAFGIDDTSMLFVSVGSERPVPAYASITEAA
jgi:hypothetical protein